MKPEHVKEILSKIQKVRIAVYGDFCIDAYWMLDPAGSEVSVETSLKGEAVTKQRYTPGGAANVVANLAVLNPLAIAVVGVVGNDIFGREMTRQFIELGVDTSKLIIQEENFDTYTYCKRYLEGKEQRRIDFGFFNQRTEETDHTLLKAFREAIEQSDGLIINQQIPNSNSNQFFIDGVNQIIGDFPEKIVLVDSRHYAHFFKGVYLKANEKELANLNQEEKSSHQMLTLGEIKRLMEKTYRQSQKPIFVTRGSRGLVVFDENGFHAVPGIQIIGKIDPVGAGDTLLSAIACCLAVGADAVEAAEIGNFAAAVTVKKLYQTGTASPEEILAIASDPDFIYQPELAEDIRQAKYLANSDIEICCELKDISWGKIKHAVFDHDGTISTLRQGWEAIMEVVMLKAILGEQYKTADESLYHHVRQRVLEYIDQSTGIQTILQMEALVELVKEFGIVPREKILDKFQYKAIYNEALLAMVNLRIKKLEKGELDVGDFTVKGAIRFLGLLRDQGVTLYLASGTDEENVISEAKALGYEHLFNGGIYGAVGDVTKYSKKMVIEKILVDHKLEGSELVVFGDGPVEIRESRKHQGIAVGIASDEIRRYGLNAEKRTRLIKAGAHVVVPDFSQADRLFGFLFPDDEV